MKNKKIKQKFVWKIQHSLNCLVGTRRKVELQLAIVFQSPLTS